MGHCLSPDTAGTAEVAHHAGMLSAATVCAVLGRPLGPGNCTRFILSRRDEEKSLRSDTAHCSSMCRKPKFAACSASSDHVRESTAGDWDVSEGLFDCAHQ